MRISCVMYLLGAALLATIAAASPIVKREAESEDLSPLNEVGAVHFRTHGLAHSRPPCSAIG